MSKKEQQLKLKSQILQPSKWLPLLLMPIPRNLRLLQLRPQTPEEIEKEKKEKEELLVRRQKMLLQLADGGAQENDDMDFNEGGNEHAPAEEEAPESLAPDVRESAFGQFDQQMHVPESEAPVENESAPTIATEQASVPVDVPANEPVAVSAEAP